MIAEPWNSIFNRNLAIELHTKGILRHGGVDGIRDSNQLDSNIASAVTANMYYSEDEKYDPLLFASLLLQKFSTTQVFLDGNKRIAWLSCVHVLSREHLSIEASEEEAIEFCLRISTDSSLTIEFISSWLADRLRSMELDNAWEEDPQEQFPF